ncbi:transposable element Tcb2 transposase [Trichonephila clavipes]|nr:transposable element Tcb2 transposase [Trichonephila clavipes]
MRVLKQWTYDRRTNRKTGSGQQKAVERCLPECVIERYSGLTPGVMVWGTILYHGRYSVLRIEAQRMQLLPWPAYSPVMSPIEPVCDVIGRHLARDPRPAASKDELLLRIQAIWNSHPQEDIQYLFDSMPRRIAALMRVHGCYTKY